MLEAVTRRFGELVEIRWHAYELRPDPVPLPEPDSEYIAEHWENRVLPMAAERGLIMRVPRRQVRSRRALQAALFAREQGRFNDVDHALYRARFEQDADLEDMDVLGGIVAAAGLDADALRYALKTKAYQDAFAEDLAIAHAIGVRGVPIALVGPANEDLAQFLRQAEPVSGAVPEEWMMDAVERARTRAVPP